MKRVAVVVIFIAVMASLFTFNVIAATPDTFNTYQVSISDNNVQIVLRATQLKTQSTGTSMLPGGMESTIFITCRISNLSSIAAIINPISFNIETTDVKTISHINSISTDLYLVKEPGYFNIVPSPDFAYERCIIVPPSTDLYFVGEICITAQLDQTGQTIEDIGLRGINFYDTYDSYILGHGDYPYGIANNLKPIIDAIEGLTDAYNGVTGSDSISSSSSGINNQSSQVHAAESSYFTQNSQALINSGISNPNFEAADRTSINSGMGSVRSLFNDLWSNIGALRNIYIYALMMCLATYLLRHRPWIGASKSRRKE